MFFIIKTYCHLYPLLGDSYLTSPSYVKSDGDHIYTPYIWETFMNGKYEYDMNKKGNLPLNHENNVFSKVPSLSDFFFHTSITFLYDPSGTHLILP